MTEKHRVIHFLNQFFAQIGGEEKADSPFSCEEMVIGPGLAFQKALGDEYEIIATFICGDNYLAENRELVIPEMVERMRALKADIVIAGPAFNAGRYGPNCGAVCKAAGELPGVTAVTGMYEENPGVELYRKDCYIVRTKDSAIGMRQAVPSIVSLIKKIVDGKETPSPDQDDYFAKGFKRNVFVEESGAERALRMALDKIAGHPFRSELVMPPFESITPAPAVKDIGGALIALVTDAGVTDKENTCRLESARASKYLELDITGMDTLSPENFCSVHGGFDTSAANGNPNILVPLDIIRRRVNEGKIGGLLNTLYSTTGNGTSLKNSMRYGAEIAKKLTDKNVKAVILTST